MKQVYYYTVRIAFKTGDINGAVELMSDTHVIHLTAEPPCR
jgi:hypothetical protein